MSKTKVFLLLAIMSLSAGCNGEAITAPDAEEKEIQKVEIDKQTPEEGEQTAAPKSESTDLVTISISKAVLEEKLPSFAKSYNFHLHRDVQAKPENAPCSNGSDGNGEFVRCEKGENAGQKIYLNTEVFNFKKEDLKNTLDVQSKQILKGDTFELEISAANELCEDFSEKKIKKTADSKTVTLTSVDLSFRQSFSLMHVLNETSLERAHPILHGMVTDDSGAGIEGVSVTAEVEGASEPIILTAKTDAKGFHLIKGIRPEVSVEVKVQKEGFKGQTKSLTMKTITEVGAQCNPELNNLDFKLSK